jgi:hypothetical protein
MPNQQKITIDEMRSYAGQWGDDVRLSELEPRFVCLACGHRGADVRPLFEQARMGMAQRNMAAVTAF